LAGALWIRALRAAGTRAFAPEVRAVLADATVVVVARSFDARGAADAIAGSPVPAAAPPELAERSPVLAAGSLLAVAAVAIDGVLAADSVDGASFVAVSFVAVSFVAVSFVAVSFVAVSFVAVSFVAVSFVAVSFVAGSFVAGLFVAGSVGAGSLLATVSVVSIAPACSFEVDPPRDASTITKISSNAPAAAIARFRLLLANATIAWRSGLPPTIGSSSASLAMVTAAPSTAVLAAPSTSVLAAWSTSVLAAPSASVLAAPSASVLAARSAIVVGAAAAVALAVAVAVAAALAVAADARGTSAVCGAAAAAALESLPPSRRQTWSSNGFSSAAPASEMPAMSSDAGASPRAAAADVAVAGLLGDSTATRDDEWGDGSGGGTLRPAVRGGGNGRWLAAPCALLRVAGTGGGVVCFARAAGSGGGTLFTFARDGSGGGTLFTFARDGSGGGVLCDLRGAGSDDAARIGPAAWVGAVLIPALFVNAVGEMRVGADRVLEASFVAIGAAVAGVMMGADRVLEASFVAIGAAVVDAMMDADRVLVASFVAVGAAVGASLVGAAGFVACAGGALCLVARGFAAPRPRPRPAGLRASDIARECTRRVSDENPA